MLEFFAIYITGLVLHLCILTLCMWLLKDVSTAVIEKNDLYIDFRISFYFSFLWVFMIYKTIKICCKTIKILKGF